MALDYGVISRASLPSLNFNLFFYLDGWMLASLYMNQVHKVSMAARIAAVRSHMLRTGTEPGSSAGGVKS